MSPMLPAGLIADLIEAGHKDAAVKLLRMHEDAERQRSHHEACKYELTWLLRYLDNSAIAAVQRKDGDGFTVVVSDVMPPPTGGSADRRNALSGHVYIVEPCTRLDTLIYDGGLPSLKSFQKEH